MPGEDPPITAAARRQLHFFFAVDCSGSMSGDKIASVNYAARSAIPGMRAAAADNPEDDVFVHALRFADDVQWRTPRTGVPVALFEWTDLTAGGETNMGAALEALAQALTPDALPGAQLPPVLVLLSDGLPTDDFEAGLAALAASPFGASAIRVAIAIGSDADLPILQSFIGHGGMQPLQANNAETLVSRVTWAVTAPVKAVSVPAGAADPTQILAQDAAAGPSDGGAMVW